MLKETIFKPFARIRRAVAAGGLRGGRTQLVFSSFRAMGGALTELDLRNVRSDADVDGHISHNTLNDHAHRW